MTVHQWHHHRQSHYGIKLWHLHTSNNIQEEIVLYSTRTYIPVVQYTLCRSLKMIALVSPTRQIWMTSCLGCRRHRKGQQQTRNKR